MRAASVLAESHDRNFSIAQVLLISEIFVSCQQYVEPGFFGYAQQVPVRERVSPLLMCSFEVMAMGGLVSRRACPGRIE